MVLTDINIAPMAGVKTIPYVKRMPVAMGIVKTLYLASYNVLTVYYMSLFNLLATKKCIFPFQQALPDHHPSFHAWIHHN